MDKNLTNNFIWAVFSNTWQITWGPHYRVSVFEKPTKTFTITTNDGKGTEILQNLSQNVNHLADVENDDGADRSCSRVDPRYWLECRLRKKTNAKLLKYLAVQSGLLWNQIVRSQGSYTKIERSQKSPRGPNYAVQSLSRLQFGDNNKKEDTILQRLSKMLRIVIFLGLWNWRTHLRPLSWFTKPVSILTRWRSRREPILLISSGP